MPKVLGSLLVLLVLAGACTRSPARLPPTLAPQATPPPFVTAAPEQALPALIAAERDASRRGDLPLLVQLWADDARIVDGRGTADPADDLVWSGRPAILDRYRVAVLLNPPPAFTAPPAPTIQVAGDAATAQLGNDRWRFVRRAGRWWIAELAY